MLRRAPYLVAGTPVGAGAAFVLFIALVLICYLLSGLVINLILGAAGFSDFSQLMADSSGRMLYRTLTALSGVISWGLPAVGWAVYLGGFKVHLGLDTVSQKRKYALAFLIPVFLLPLASSLIIPQDWSLFPESMKPLQEWASGQEERVNSILIGLLSESGAGILVVNVLAVAVIPAVVEEMLFRGVLLNVFCRWMPVHVAVWLGAALFSLVHFQLYGFFARLFLGAVLGYLYVGSGDLRNSILAHFAHNLTSLVIVVLASKGVLPSTLLSDRLEFGIWLTLASCLTGFVLLYVYFRRVSHQIPLDSNE